MKNARNLLIVLPTFVKDGQLPNLRFFLLPKLRRSAHSVQQEQFRERWYRQLIPATGGRDST